MSSATHCTECGAALRPGTLGNRCPRCLIQLALDAPAISPDAPGPTSLGTAGRFGDYELLEKIGEGGMGVVYRARQLSLNRIVAVKMIQPGRVGSPEMVLRFRAEAEAAASLHHPNIVSIHETGECVGQHFFSMDYIEGQNLADAVREGPLPAARAAGLVEKIAAAVQYAHEHHILHRDLKPSNVIVDELGEPHVTDFGLAKRLTSDLAPRTSDLTLTGQVFGSPRFMPPEQASGRRGAIGPHSDVYGLGAILYYLLTGRPPFVGETLETTLAQVLDQEPVPPRLLNASVPRDLETICLKCLEKEPSRRYASAQAVVAELQRFLEMKPIQARPVGFVGRTSRWCRRKPVRAGLISALVIVFLVGAAGVLWQWQEAEAQRRKANASEAAATQSAQEAREKFYAADMIATQQALREGSLGQAQDYLMNHVPQPGEPDLRGFEWRYFFNQAKGNQLHRFIGHSNMVYCLSFSPDGRWLASGGWDGQVFIWDVIEWSLITSFKPGGGAVFSIAFHVEGDLMAVGTTSLVTLWQLTDVRKPKLLRQRTASSALVAFVPNSSRIAVGQGAYIYGENGGSVQIWEIETLNPVKSFPESGGRFALTADGRFMFSGLLHQQIRKSDLATGKELAVADFPGSLPSLACSADGRWLVTSSGETAQLWDGVRLVPIRTLLLRDKKTRIDALAFSPDSQLVAVTDSDQLIHIYPVNGDSESAVLRGHRNEVWPVCFSPDGRLLATGGMDETVCLWDPRLVAKPSSLSPVEFNQWLEGPALSSDGKWMTIGSPRETAKVGLWDLDTMTLSWSLTNAMRPLAFSPDATRVVTADRAVLKVWNTITRALELTLRIPSLSLSEQRLSLSPDGSRLIAASGGGVVTVWNTVTGEQVSQFQAHSGEIKEVRFFSDGNRFVTGGMDRTARVWSTETFQKLGEFRGHKRELYCVAVSPDGRLIATGSVDGTARVWDVSDERELLTLRGYKRAVIKVTFCGDGKTLATGNSDGVVHLWNLRTGREVASWEGDGARACPVFSSDGSRLVVIDNTQTAHVFSGPATSDMAPPRARPLSQQWVLSLAEVTSRRKEELEKLATVTPSNSNAVQVLLRRGLLQETSQDLTAALATYSQALVALERITNGWTLDVNVVLRRRAHLHEVLGRQLEARADLLRACNIPPRDSNITARLVDLTDYFNAGFEEDWLNPTVTGNNLAGLGKGVKTLAGVSFDLRGIVQLSSPRLAQRRSEYPTVVRDIRIGLHARRLLFLHGTAYRIDPKAEIARYVVHFADGRTETLGVTYGRDVIDWWRRLSDERLPTLAWEGRNRHSLLQLFLYTWENPKPDEEIQSIDFLATGTDAASFLLAITAE